MNVKEVLLLYMKEHGYNGLVAESCECGCHNEDLMPCDGSDMAKRKDAVHTKCPLCRGSYWDKRTGKPCRNCTDDKPEFKRSEFMRAIRRREHGNT